MLHYYFEGILNMEARSVSHGTLVIERSFAKTPERVFAAFPIRRRWDALDEED